MTKFSHNFSKVFRLVFLFELPLLNFLKNLWFLDSSSLSKNPTVFTIASSYTTLWTNAFCSNCDCVFWFHVNNCEQIVVFVVDFLRSFLIASGNW